MTAWVLRRKPKPHRITRDEAEQIRAVKATTNLTAWEVSQMFGVSFSSVQSICCGRRWAK